MDALVEAAVAGTARRPAAEIATGTPVDGLAAALPAPSVERRVLLAAGAWAAYRLAGFVPEAAPEVPPSSPPEERLACAPGAGRVLARLFSGAHAQLLAEACARLRQAGRILPPELLPAALTIRDAEQRAALLPVLGERGRWLAGLNPPWRWAVEALPQGDALPADAEAIWQEGTSERRLEVLHRLRLGDPTRGREWLAATWRQEKAEFRAEALPLLASGLGPDDEPFLEAALDDRGGEVRARAAALLARLPESAFAARVRERADAMLNWKGNALYIEPPTANDRAAERDGVATKPPQGTGERAWWLAQTLRLVPPSHWAERFLVTPAELIASAITNSWAEPALQGWSLATELHGDAEWAGALWDAWRAGPVRMAADGGAKRRKKAAAALDAVPVGDLLAVMLADEAERRVLALFAASALTTLGPDDALWALGAPWSAQFGMAVVAALRDAVRSLSGAKPEWESAWLPVVGRAAVALPEACLAVALEPWELPTAASDARHTWYLRQWTEAFDGFVETLRLRQRLVKEIPA